MPRPFNPVATAVTYVTTGNTVDFNGTGAQTIPAFNYNNLTSRPERHAHVGIERHDRRGRERSRPAAIRTRSPAAR